MVHFSALSEVTDRLTPLSDTPALDASVLLAQIVHKPRTWVMAHPELTLTTEQLKQLDDSLRRLERGESFPYVLGHWEFFGMEFEVTPDVLIPRPETELLVERAIARLQGSPRRSSVADIGTGSGAIAISIALHVPDVHVLATDISHPALQIARRNAGRFDALHKIDFVQCDLLPEHHTALWKASGFDLITANLPYIPTETLHNLPVFGREPTPALDGGKDGLQLIRRLLGVAPAWLASEGMILLEIESTTGSQVSDLARDFFPEATIHVHQDFAGRDRLLEICP
jgi:release factor glutamine methyltransferase